MASYLTEQSCSSSTPACFYSVDLLAFKHAVCRCTTKQVLAISDRVQSFMLKKFFSENFLTGFLWHIFTLYCIAERLQKHRLPFLTYIFFIQQNSLLNQTLYSCIFLWMWITRYVSSAHAINKNFFFIDGFPPLPPIYHTESWCHCLLLSCLDYSNSRVTGLLVATLHLQHAQNTATHLVLQTH